MGGILSGIVHDFFLGGCMVMIKVALWCKCIIRIILCRGVARWVRTFISRVSHVVE